MSGGERSRELYERACRSLPGGNSRSTLWVAPHPPYAARGQGWEVVDVDGQRSIDLQNNYTALVHGHAFGPVVQAATAALSHGSAFGLPTAAEIDLAEHLAARVGWARHWRFANSGTEAVMMAVRAARARSGRDGVVRFDNCYHGGWEAVVPRGARGVPGAAQRDVIVLPLGDEQALAETLAEHGRRLAAVLLDPMPNWAGLRPLERSFVELVREQTERLGIALVLDEVVAFRLSPGGGMRALYGIEGDLIALGKLVGGGFPAGAIGGRERWMEVFDPRLAEPVAHGGTFCANPVSMRAGLAALSALDAAAIERIGALGARLRAGLERQGWEVSGHGSLLKVRGPGGTGGREALWWRLYEQGVLIAVNGLMGVSTPMDERVIDRALSAFGRALSAFGRARRA
jgi:glutamate-1-semialdehyde 2,1-aminomutase